MRAESHLGAPPGTTWLQLDDRVVVATPAASRPIVLDPSSSSVWPILSSGGDQAEVAEVLERVNGADAATATQFAASLVEQLLLGGFLEDRGEQSTRPRRFHARCSPCDTAPLLKGPTTTLELRVGGVGVTLLVLDRTGVAPHLEQWQIDGTDLADPSDLFVIGRIPHEGSSGLFDHYGVLLARTESDRAIDLADLLIGDLQMLSADAVVLRGVVLPAGDGVVVVHERWRQLANDAHAAGLTGAPSPTAVIGLEWTSDGASVSFRSPESPHDLQRSPLRALGVPEVPSDRASSVAMAATLLRDPCALDTAAQVAEQVDLAALPVDGLVATFAAWLDDPGAPS